MDDVRAAYVDLLIRALTNTLYSDPPMDPWSPPVYDATRRAAGEDWPSQAMTMIGTTRLRHLADCVRTVIADDIPGDLMETGVWRGGACMLMRGVLRAYGDPLRTVWGADSFQGLPPPQRTEDEAIPFHTFDALAVDLETVKANARAFGLLDDRLRFLPGWFDDTLPQATVSQLALLRLDGDMYDSTWTALAALYPKVSTGGFIIVDDYDTVPACKLAVNQYRRGQNIDTPMASLDGGAVWWRKA